MQDKRSPFKIPPKKHHPRGMRILHEDHDIIVISKENGLLTVSTNREKEKTAHFLLNDYVRKGNPRAKNRVYIVHRLDRETSGVLVFAKSEKAKEYLQKAWQDFDKTYFAVVHGRLQEPEGEITSYLLENNAHRMYSVKDPNKGKFAKTGYRAVRASRNFTLLEITLFTGRKNQIRVHLAEAGHPVVGDKMYGKGDKGFKQLALHAASLSITHPHTNEKMTFETEPPTYFNSLVKGKAAESGNRVQKE